MQRLCGEYELVLVAADGVRVRRRVPLPGLQVACDGVCEACEADTFKVDPGYSPTCTSADRETHPIKSAEYF